MQFTDADLVTGTEESRRRAREELRRQRRLHFAESSSWPRLDLADLRFGRFYVEHTPSGTRYRVVRGEVTGVFGVRRGARRPATHHLRTRRCREARFKRTNPESYAKREAAEVVRRREARQRAKGGKALTERELEAAVLEVASVLGYLCHHDRPAWTSRRYRTAIGGAASQ